MKNALIALFAMFYTLQTFQSIVISLLCETLFYIITMFVFVATSICKVVLVALAIQFTIKLMMLSLVFITILSIFVIISIIMLFVLLGILTTCLFMAIYISIAMLVFVCYKLFATIIHIIGFKKLYKIASVFLVFLSSLLPVIFQMILNYEGKCFDFNENGVFVLRSMESIFYFITIGIILLVPSIIEIMTTYIPCITTKQKEQYAFVTGFYLALIDMAYFSDLDGKNPFYIHCVFIPVLIVIFISILFHYKNKKMEMNVINEATDYKKIVMIFSIITKMFVDVIVFGERQNSSFGKFIFAILILILIKLAKKKFVEKSEKNTNIALFFVFYTFEPMASSIVNNIFFKKSIWFFQNYYTIIFITTIALVLGFLCTVVKVVKINQKK